MKYGYQKSDLKIIGSKQKVLLLGTELFAWNSSQKGLEQKWFLKYISTTAKYSRREIFFG